MIDALKGIPTISLSLDNPNRLNNEDEKPLSIEMIFPDGKKGFQENAGVTHYGGYFTNFSKKSFRIYAETGEIKNFNYKFFEDSEIENWHLHLHLIPQPSDSQNVKILFPDHFTLKIPH